MKQALLYLSFGGPNGPDDVLGFMENVTKNRPIPRERLIEVSQHYHFFGGKSPINEINLEIIEKIKATFKLRGFDLPIYFGNRNWEPYVGDTVKQMALDGIEQAYVFATSAYGSYSGCRQYLQDIANANASINGVLSLYKLRHFYNHQGFVEPFATGTINAIASLLESFSFGDIAILYSAHSIPESMAKSGPYEEQLAFVKSAISQHLLNKFKVDILSEQVFQSRSGSPQQRWLEPDISDAMQRLHSSNNTRAFVVVPIGFISDHMEVIYDLDTVGKQTAIDLGSRYERVPTPSLSLGFAEMIADLVQEQLDPTFHAEFIDGSPQPIPVCAQDCCLTPNPGNHQRV